ncbi:MAG TPA: DedA family protein [Gemmatimonas aurantiaca]|uniref:DedA family protein n=2 Tax=Gemmatimonas aurantiaca TaxID=173480 RepID=A0A3D4V9W1_9BACT|nr:DedA family protein [Gemmatimonas aurantiaca]
MPVGADAPPNYLSGMSPAPRFLTRFLARLQQWADAGWSNAVVLGWGLLQGCIFPGLADLFFLPLALARPERAYRLALVATAGTVIGSVLLYWLGAEALSVLEGPIARWLGFSPDAFTEYRARLAKFGAWAILASTMSPLSTKLTSIASGAIGVPFVAFAGALLAGRLTRTLALAWLVRHGGAQAVARWVRPANTTVDSAPPRAS